MKFYSTRDRSSKVSLHDAVLRGLAPDGGLYMPENFPKIHWDMGSSVTFPELAFHISSAFCLEDLSEAVLQEICESAFDFPVPIPALEDNIYSLELFHGPTLAFKDFGARFMARLMAHFNRGEDKELTVLVATSGDTGGAVANGFFGLEGINVVLLYPSGKVSPLQEKQLTTLGGNITALEVEGTFDDCQRMVKAAFADPDLKEVCRLTAANSINIARLIPQSFYYAWAKVQLKQDLIFSVPSGNFGNLTAALFLNKMGANLGKIIGATNINDTIPRYLHSGKYSPKESVNTISNAMDVGDPSNFERLKDLFSGSLDLFRESVVGARFTDDETRACMRSVYEREEYILDPHGAIGYLALKKEASNKAGVLLETAHPAKFIEVVEETLEIELPLPEALAEIANKEGVTTKIGPNFNQLRDCLTKRS